VAQPAGRLPQRKLIEDHWWTQASKFGPQEDYFFGDADALDILESQ